MGLLIKFTLLLMFVSRSYCKHYTDSFHEELLLKPLYSEQLYAYFQFTTLWDVESRPESFQHCRLFPKGLAEIISRHDIDELHLTLTGGLWRYGTWGYPMYDAGPGLELWAWFKPHAKNIDAQWKELSNSLSGLFCASLNFVDQSNSLSPEYSLRPSGAVSHPNLTSNFLRYATLPREVVCTENLTPWKKLMPCDLKHGLVTLLNSQSIHSTRYHSLGLHLRNICANVNCKRTKIELRQTVSLVYDYLIVGTRNWSLWRLFNVGLIDYCPLATTSSIYVDVSSNASRSFTLNPPPHNYTTVNRGGSKFQYAKYDLKLLQKPLNLMATQNNKFVATYNALPLLVASQYLAGFGQERGSIVLDLQNSHINYLDVVVLQHLPWYVPVYLHTLKVVSNGVKLNVLQKKYVAGKERTRPYYIELLIRIPPRSITTISLDLDYVFLKWQEYPPDANHGFYIGSALITSVLPLSRNSTFLPGNENVDFFRLNGYLVQLRTETLLVTLPTPDFSMPYNVICLACTVVALAFGPLHNITTKRLRFKKSVKVGLGKRVGIWVKGLFKKKDKVD